jgi:hypothetical protein
LPTGDRERSSGQTHLFNISTKAAMDRTSSQPQAKLRGKRKKVIEEFNYVDLKITGVTL